MHLEMTVSTKLMNLILKMISLFQFQFIFIYIVALKHFIWEDKEPTTLKRKHQQSDIPL